ncbi:MAG: hypothetical protein P1R58_02530 [bacterium]|nr:hypothetical protein [bacterium]
MIRIMITDILHIRRFMICLLVGALIFLAASCGDDDEEESIVAPPDTTDTIPELPDTGFTYEPDQTPALLADGYKGVLSYTRPDQGFPVTTEDTVTLLIEPDSFYLYHLTRSSNLCDSRGKLDFGKGDLTVLLSSQPIMAQCDSLRTPRGTMQSVYTESSLVMDTARNVLLPSGELERAQYSFDLVAFNIYDSLVGLMRVDQYLNTDHTVIEDSVELSITDSLYSFGVLTGTDFCSTVGSVEIDPVNGAISFAVDSTISDTTICKTYLNLKGTYEADFRYNRVLITGAKYKPIEGSFHDSIIVRLELMGQ